MPIELELAETKTGAKLPDSITLFNPEMISSSVSSPFSRYFSSRASSLSATASIKSEDLKRDSAGLVEIWKNRLNREEISFIREETDDMIKEIYSDFF